MHGLAGRNLALDRVEEADEFLMSMALHVPSDHGPVEDVEGGEQGRRPIALVVVRERGAPARLERQARLGPVQRLDLRFFVDGKHHGVRRRLDIEPNHVMEFLGEGWIIRQLELPPAMGREAVRLPDLLHRRDRQSGDLRHGLPGPMRRLMRRRRKREAHHLVDPWPLDGRLSGWPRLVPQQPVHALGHEPLLPAPDAGLRLVRAAHDLHRPEAVRRQKDNPGAPDMLLRRIPVRDDARKPSPPGIRNSD